MKIFNSFNNFNNDTCSICNKGDEKKAVLIPIVGTEQGNLMECLQVHLDCINLLCHKQNDGSMLLFQFIPPKENINDNQTIKNIN